MYNALAAFRGYRAAKAQPKEKAEGHPQQPGEQPRSSQVRDMPGRGRPFRPGQSGNPGGARAFPHKTWPLAREILYNTILVNRAAFEQTLTEVMLTKKGALQVLELLRSSTARSARVPPRPRW
jgi:hypothetical protein